METPLTQLPAPFGDAPIEASRRQHALVELMAALATFIGDEFVPTLRQYAEDTRDADPVNTLRAIRADLVVFSRWCAEGGHRAHPAAPRAVALFVDDAAANRAPATVRRYLASVTWLHRVTEASDPCKAEVVRKALKRMHNAKGRDQKQAAPINDDAVVTMLAKTGRRLRDLRDKALLVTAYSTMARRAELTALLREDLQVDAEGWGTVIIRRSKTDQDGRGDVAAVTPDAMVHLQAWLAAAAITTGPLFRSVRRGDHIGSTLLPRDVSRIFKRMAQRARLPPADVASISGHSTRVGAAQDMVKHNIEMVGLMQAGRWKTPTMPARYARNLKVRRGAVAKLAAARKQFV